MTLSSPNFRYFSSLSPQKIILSLLAIVIISLWFYIEQGKEEDSYPIYLVAILWILMLAFCLWAGNLLLYKGFDRWFPEKLKGDSLFIIRLLLSLLLSIVYINVTYVIFKNRYTDLPPSTDQMILLNIYGIFFLIPVLSIQFGLQSLQKWKKANLEQARLKKEQVQSELIALKSHLSPHFMFNNLNILSSLINGKNYVAHDFLDGFSEVYRYVLKNRDAELITLKEELDFVRTYAFLLKQRFTDNLKIHIEVPENIYDFLLPPLSLQMLLENALKHNKLSDKNPLEIKIFSNTIPELIVHNNYNPRTIPEYEKTGTGLDNIKKRYLLIVKREITIHSDQSVFYVKLPLIPIAKK